MTELAIELRKQIAHTTTYRVRHGNGEAGSILGKRYQDIMAYYTPTNPQTQAQQAWRAIVAQANLAAKALTPEQKEPYVLMAKEEGGQTWASVFVREYLAAVDRSSISGRAISGLALSGFPGG